MKAPLRPASHMRKLNFLSAATAPIEVRSPLGSTCDRASGFFYRCSNKEVYLITNWHVFTGRNHKTPTTSKTGAIPLVAVLRLHPWVSTSRELSLSASLQEFVIPLNDEDGESPQWFEHPQYRHNVDVVAIRMPLDQLTGTLYRCVNEYPRLEQRFQAEVMDDIFVIGYPWGLTGGTAALPLFKRGSVASEPLIDFKGLPRFLIDCRTAESMSGAPVLGVRRGFWAPSQSVGPGIPPDSVFGTIENFAGVYSGRLYRQDGEKDQRDLVTDIGIVWKWHLIDEIIEGQQLGTPLSTIVLS